MMKNDIRNISSDALKSWLISHGEKPFRAKQIMHWLWKQPVQDFDEMTNLSKPLRHALKSDFVLSQLHLVTTQNSSDGTVKTGFRLSDNEFIEGVLIPSKERVTACISTQVGCRMGCKFCATAGLGFHRNLSAGEIYLQVWHLNQIAEEHYKTGLSNIVIMGMGEPLDNYSAVTTAVQFLTGDEGLGMSHRRITLSTAGVADKIKQMADDGIKIKLSLSLHAVNDKLRSQIMPINNKHTIQVLAESLQYYHGKTNHRISYEYVLLKNINDQEIHARELAEFTKITPCKINLIEYNPVSGLGFEKSTEESTQRFMKFLEGRNLIVKLRRSRGADVDAACGQLANKFRNK
ncbi:MAG: 23S rRNA (adenine(2503)-C(2))-methyltransferase RlmN [Bacteroidales bacterium]|jgi:23S rRNA (adenine2503-C2)-methyltransferase|nr:23S rRNA (adenine(2503)-C(2))-methyltransferase RlmN [Bacteroidales bacterium]